MLIAQITDFHLKAKGELAYGVIDTASCLTAAVAALAALKPAPDVVVGTGDLTDTGRPEDYEYLRELLAPLDMPVYLIPGNHDEREAFRQAFGLDGYLPPAGFLHYAVEEYPLRLIGLDTVVPGEPGGLLCDERLAWLARTLAAAPDRPTVIIMHHPPFPTGIAHMDRMGLAGIERFAALLARHPQVERVLCGHLHRPIEARIGVCVIASTAPSTAHQVALDLRPDGPSAFTMEPPGYQLHLWRPGSGMISHTALIGAFPGPYPFHYIPPIED
jgi:3',5'-cyclic-AMP phosphodiesterase